MSTYKVIQDIEAEDKLVGPLSLRQFLYAIGAVVGGYLCFLSISKGAPFLLVVFFPLTLGVGFFAVPWKKEQSTEIWALAHIRFYIKPKVRIWSQSGIREYVTVLAKAPKRKVYTSNGLTPDEVQSRLKALASTIDTHGWAVKGATAEDLSRIDPLIEHNTSDRLVGSTAVPREAMTHLKIEDDIAAHEDMLDDANLVSKNLSGMIDRQTAERHARLTRQVEAEVNQAPVVMPGTTITTRASVDGPATNQWFMNAPGTPGGPTGPTQITIITPGASTVTTASTDLSADEKALAAQFKSHNEDVQKAYYGHLHVVQPLNADGKPEPVATPAIVADDSVEPLEAPVIAPAVEKAATAPRPAAAPVQRAAIKPAVRKTAPKAVAAKPPVKAAAKPAVKTTQPAPVTAAPDPAILALAQNDDLDIATIARQINKHKSPTEVEIRLH